MNLSEQTLGICTAGVEEVFLSHILERARSVDHFVYMEIGIACGQTFRTVQRVLSDAGLHFKMIGIDPHEGFCFNLKDLPFSDIICATREVAMKNFSTSLDFVFIDGCHAIPCATGDFLSVEPLVKPGGLVVFHDFGEGAVGQIQPHCNLPCNPREAVRSLGLFDQTRPGWIRLPDWCGDKARQGADCGVFQKL